jgi:hypothetical protein
MADRPWRIETTPVPRARWSDEPGAEGTHTDPVAIGRRRSADPLLVVLVVTGLIVALAKPWGAARSPDAAPIAPDVPRTALPAVVIAPTAAALLTADLPPEVFAPAARTCMQDVGWRVCVLGPDGAADQATINHFDPHAPALVDEGGTPAPADPVVVLTTTTAATLAFYAPNSFSVPGSGQAPRPIDARDGSPVIPSESVSITAWYVDEARGSLTLALNGGAPVTQGGRVAANVFVPAAEHFTDRGAWTAGRYIVWIRGTGSRAWNQLFDFDVVGPGTAAR